MRVSTRLLEVTWLECSIEHAVIDLGYNAISLWSVGDHDSQMGDWEGTNIKPLPSFDGGEGMKPLLFYIYIQLEQDLYIWEK